MNLYLYNCSNTYNYGSMMMAENFITWLDRVSGEDHRYYVETGALEHVTRLKAATGSTQVVMSPLNALFADRISKLDYLLALAGRKSVLKEGRPALDMVVVLGGDDLTEDYGWKGPLMQAVKLVLLQRSGLKVVLLGQTMGPYGSWRRPLMARLLGRLDRILPRDPITHRYLSGMGLSNLRLTDDLALMPLARQEQTDNGQKYITYCPSELIYRYAKESSRTGWLALNQQCVAILLERYPEQTLIFLAHVLQPSAVDDRPLVRELFTWAAERYPGRVAKQDDILLPYQVRQLIGQSRLTVSARMHPVISSIQCQVPALAFSYSQKYWGIIGERYGLGEYILDVRQADFAQLAVEFTAKLEQIDRNHGKIVQVMAEQNSQAATNIRKSLEELATLKANLGA